MQLSYINKNTYKLIAFELRASLYRYTFMISDMNQACLTIIVRKSIALKGV